MARNPSTGSKITEATGEFVIEPGGQDEPPIGGENDKDGIRWEMVMSLFLRLCAAVWMIKGIGFWMLVLGMGDLPLSEERRLRQALIVGFAILDCSASVGLWLLTPWGKSLWLFVAFAEIVLGLWGGSGTIGLFAATSAILMVFCFFVLSFVMGKRHR